MSLSHAKEPTPLRIPCSVLGRRQIFAVDAQLTDVCLSFAEYVVHCPS